MTCGSFQICVPNRIDCSCRQPNRTRVCSFPLLKSLQMNRGFSIPYSICLSSTLYNCCVYSPQSSHSRKHQQPRTGLRTAKRHITPTTIASEHSRLSFQNKKELNIRTKVGKEQTLHWFARVQMLE